VTTLFRSAAPAALLLFLLSSPVPAQPAGPLFIVQTVDGKTPSGWLRQLGPDWTLMLQSGTENVTVPGKAFLSLRRHGQPLPPFPEDGHLILANGDRIPMDRPRLVGEKLLFRNPDLGGGEEVAVPLAALVVLWLEPPLKADHPEMFRRRLVAGQRPRDLVVLTNGDSLSGSLENLDGNRIEVEADNKKVRIDLKQAAAIALNTELADQLRPKGLYARVVLTGTARTQGARIALASASCRDGRTLEGVTLFGAKLSVPLERVAELVLLQGHTVYLSDLKPARYEALSYLDLTWPLVADGSVAGNDLRLGASTYDKGLGMHAPCRVTYNLAGGYRRFEALVGLDARTGREGRARIRLLADGQPVGPDPQRELTGRDEPLAVRVDVTGVKELVLEANLGRRGDVQAHVNWADARLVR